MCNLSLRPTQAVETSPVGILEVNGGKKHHRNVGYIVDIHTVRRLNAVKLYTDSSEDKTFRRKTPHHSSDLKSKKSKKAAYLSGMV
jgi:hypothetical protein